MSSYQNFSRQGSVHTGENNFPHQNIYNNSSSFEEPSYQIAKKEFITFKMETDEQVISKDDFFRGGDDSFDQHTYEDNVYGNVIGDTSKTYFKKLYSLPVAPEVKRKVEEDIIGSGKRIHQLPDDVICSLVINAHQQLGIPCDIVQVMAMFDIDPRKSRVLQLLQKVSTKTTLASNQENAFAMIVVEPSKYIGEVFEAYLKKINSEFRDKEQTVANIKKIMLKLEEMYPPIVQKPPRECASILVYLYLKGKLDVSSRRKFNKKIFSELPGIVSTKFDSCFFEMERRFIELCNTNPHFMSSCYPQY